MVGQSDVATTWCAEQDIPSDIIDEFNQQTQPEMKLTSVNYSGQAAVTAVVTACRSDGHQKKKPRITRFNPSTEGYTHYS